MYGPRHLPVGAIPDVVEDQRQGLFVQPRDASGLASALKRLHEDRAELARLATEARQKVLQHYTLGRLGDHFMEIYACLVHASGDKSQSRRRA